ncbi:MAG: tetracycline resistance efflux pump [Phycisphaerales bacterium]|nr:tetracycline resistance efflux pump [Phycisphaerales bacterium]
MSGVAAYLPRRGDAITPGLMPDPAADPSDPPTIPPPTAPAAAAPLDAAASAEPGPPKGAMFAIFLVAVMDFLGFGIIIPLLPNFIPQLDEKALETDTSAVLKVTLIFSIFSICQFIGSPILGALSDRLGRRPVLVVSQLGSAAGYLMLAVAPFTGAAMLAVVYLSRVIDGFTGGNIAAAQAYISDVTTPQTRAKGMGMLGAAFGIGFSLGPALGGILGVIGERLGHRFGVPGDLAISLPAAVAAGLAALAAYLSWSRLSETRARKPSEAEVWLHPRQLLPILRNKPVVQMLALSFFIMAAFVMMESTLVIYLRSSKHFGFDQLAAGLFFGWLGLCIVVVQGGLVGRLTRRGRGEWAMAVAGPLLVAAGMACFTATAWVPALWLLMLAGAVNATGRSLQQPAVSALMSKYASPREQGTVFGVYHGLGSLARVAGPLVAAFTYVHLRNTAQFVTAGVVAVGVGVWTFALRQRVGPPVTAAAGPEAAAVEPT